MSHHHKSGSTAEPIAIIGLSCRLPDAPDPDSLWRLFRDERCSVTTIPDDRLSLDRDFARAADTPARWGSFLADVDRFDAPFFGVSPREASVMDPQQRLMLELAWECLEDSGIVPGELGDTTAGVFVGAGRGDYATLASRSGPATIDRHTFTGLDRGMIANRISFALGLRGPSLTVETAQSSSLVAVHTACESLRAGDCELAIAGGVNLNLAADSALSAAEFGALSPDGHCFTFDARANGYVRGEGGAVVVLKPLRRALTDGDPVYCVIRGSATNNDGATASLTTPSQPAQQDVLRLAYERANIATDSVQYVELHGTGTKLGDPIEAAALGAVLGDGRSADTPLLVGSAKTNVGHLEAGAGIVGLLKVALSIRNGEIPASLNFHTANPRIPLDDLGLRVPTGSAPWPRPEQPLVAGVSSFGMGGTNCHIVVSDIPAEHGVAAIPDKAPPDSVALPWVLSAKTDAALRDMAGRLLEHATAHPASRLIDIAYSLAVTRSVLPCRAAVVAADRDGFLAGLSALADGRAEPGVLRVTENDAAEVLARQYIEGAEVSWLTAAGDWNPRRVALPTYAFQRQRYWLPTGAGTQADVPDAEVPGEGSTLDLVRAHTAAVLGHASATEVPPEWTFRELGIDSGTAVELCDRLGTAIGRQVTATLIYDHPTPTRLAEFLDNGSADTAPASAASAPGSAVAEREPIAIVGMGCRFPGGVASPEDLWDLVASGRDVTSDFPTDRGWDGVSGKGGFLTDAAGFDAGFFGISPREALAMDPQQRLLLETSWETLERAGIDPKTLHGTKTGVFVGVSGQDYSTLLQPVGEETGGYLLTGSAASVASGRLAYTYGFEGPAVTVDTACSSSLVALHWACQSLRQQECTLALAGGVTVMSSPGMFVEFARQGGLAPDGRCKAFAAQADGTGWSEGVGLLLLERLSDAQHHNHPILALIRGTATNQDGASNGLTAPNGPAQQHVIHDALANANIEPADIDAIEAHGTGTTLGDPIEAEALHATYGHHRPPDRPLWLGSIKSNLGHTQAAAGAAGIIKMVMAIHHGVLPKTLHVDTPTPHVQWQDGAINLLTEPVPWPHSDRIRRAGISSFGISGTNAHTILEQPPARPDAGGVAFVFPGQGSQWPGMALELLETSPTFAHSMHACAHALTKHVDWSLLDVLADPTALDRVDVVQPALWAVMVSLAQLWQSHGITPDAVLGHSQGEIAAACIAGALTLEDGAHIIAQRSQLLTQLAGHGGMLSVGLPRDDLTTLIHQLPLDPTTLSIAAHNGPHTTVVSADPTTLHTLTHHLDTHHIHHRRIPVNYPSHSPHIEPLHTPLTTTLHTITPHPATTPFYSTVNQTWLNTTHLTPDYWYRNLRHTVEFHHAIHTLHTTGITTFIEISPHPVLTTNIHDTTTNNNDPPAHTLTTLHRNNGTLQRFHTALAEARELGIVERDPTTDRRATPFVVSAASRPALRAQAGKLREFVAARPETTLADIGLSLATTRAEFNHRAVIVPEDRDELLAGLAAVEQEGTPGPHVVEGVVAARQRVVLVFPGQGSQWPGMALELLESSDTFAQSMHACADALAEHVDWSLLDVLADAAALDRVDVVQPALWAVMVSLAQLWRSYGVEPAAVVGHSQGEIAAACVAGGLSLEDGARVVALRSQILGRLAGHGGMLSVGLPRDEVEAYLPRWDGRLSLAVVNGSASVVLSGDPAALDEITDELAARDVRVRRIAVDYASHSVQVDTVRDELLDALAPIAPRQGNIPFWSTVTGGWLDTAELDADYWFRNLRRTVLFEPVVRTLAESGHGAFIEMSPHPVLTMGMQETLADAGNPDAIALASLRRDDGGPARFLTSVGEAYVHGVPVAWRGAFPDDAARVPDLPTYQFQHQRYWLTTTGASGKVRTEDDAFWTAVQREDLAELASTLRVDEPALRPVVPALSAWRRRRQEQSTVDRWRYRIRWESWQPAESSPAGTWCLVIPDGGGPWVAAAEQALDSAGARIIRVPVEPAGADRVALAERLSGELDIDDTPVRVLSLLALGDQASLPGYPSVPAGLSGNLALLQALDDAGIPARLWCATRGAVSTAASDPPANPAQHTIWGLGRIAALEYPELWGGLVDLPATADEADQARLVAALTNTGGEDQLALRDRLWVRRLVPAPRALAAGSRDWRPPGTALITGGTGALGGRIARWLAANGAEHLVLASRRGQDAPGAPELAAELTDLGAEVTIAACDVADRRALTELLDSVTATRPLDAIFHAAGALHDGPIDALTTDQLDRALRAKLRGAWHLHELTRDLPLSAFVLFSSIGATVGMPGQGNYAPGNAFLDALAEHRRAAGLPATSIAWGPWAGGGMAEGAVHEMLDRHGLPEMAPELAISALHQALIEDETSLTVADIRWDRFFLAFTASRPSALVRGVPDVDRLVTAQAGGDEPATTEQTWTQRLAGRSARERDRAVAELVLHQVAAVLRRESLSASEARNAFKELGFDSITAVDLRNRLNNATGLRLPATLTYDCPTPSSLIDRLRAELAAGTTEASPVSEEIDNLERAFAALATDTERAEAISRVRAVLSKWVSQQDTTTGDEHPVEGASADELFALLDNELGSH